MKIAARTVLDWGRVEFRGVSTSMEYLRTVNATPDLSSILNTLAVIRQQEIV